MTSAASSSYFQGGDYVELLSAQGKAPASTWKLQGKIIKSFDKAIKGNAFQMDGSSETKMQLPKAPTPSSSSLGLTQRFLVFQLSVPHTRSFSIEIGFSDFQKIRRRLVFASAFRETTMTALHVQIPSNGVSRDQWMNFVFDLQALTEHYFPGSLFRSMESICISGSCRLKRIFTMKDAPFSATVAQESQTRMAAFKQQRLQSKENANMPIAVAGFAEMKDIPKQFVFSVGTSSLPIPTEYFLALSSAPGGSAQVVPAQTGRSAGVKSTTNEVKAPAAPKPGTSKPRTADSKCRPQAAVKSPTVLRNENESRTRSAPASRVSDRITEQFSVQHHGKGHEASPRRTESSSLNNVRASAAALAGTTAASTTRARFRATSVDTDEDKELESDASDQGFDETNFRGEQESSDKSPAESPVHQVVPLKPTHLGEARVQASPSIATQRKTHRQTVIAEIQSKLDQLTKEAEEEEERDREMFAKSVSIGNDSAEQSPIADDKSARLLTSSSKSLPTKNHESRNPWPENDLLLSPEPMVLRRMQATNKPEILFSSSLFNFDREGPTTSASDEVAIHSSKSKQLFDWDSLLEDSVGILSMSGKLPTTRQHKLPVETATKPTYEDRATNKSAAMRGLRDSHNMTKKSVDSEENDEAVDDGVLKMMEVKRRARAEKEHHESRDENSVDQTKQFHLDDGMEFNYATSPDTRQPARRSHDRRETSSSEKPTHVDHPRSPARSEADSDGDLSIDLTDNLGDIDPADEDPQPQGQPAASPSSVTSDEEEDSFNFDELVVRDRDYQPPKVSQASPERPHPLEMTHQPTVATSTRPRSSEASRSMNGRGHRTSGLPVDRKQERYAGQPPQASSTSSPVKRSNRDESAKPTDVTSSAHLMSSSHRRLASLLESTDWSQLPLSSVVSSKAPVPTTREQKKPSADPARSRQTAVGKASSSLELIYDPILRCYFDPIDRKYYTLAK